MTEHDRRKYAAEVIKTVCENSTDKDDFFLFVRELSKLSKLRQFNIEENNRPAVIRKWELDDYMFYRSGGQRFS